MGDPTDRRSEVGDHEQNGGVEAVDVEEYKRIAEAEDRHWWYRSVRALLSDSAASFLYPSVGRYLDAGCGPGGNSTWLPDAFTVFGVDVSEEALAFVRLKRRGVEAVRASVDALPFCTDSFDGLQSVTVLCHAGVSSVDGALGEYYRVLRPGGVAFLVEPAFEALRRSHDRVVMAVRRFRRTELEQRVEEAGFEVVGATYFFATLAIPALVLALADRLGGRKAHTSDLERPAVADRLFYALTAVERRLVKRWLERSVAEDLGPTRSEEGLQEVPEDPRDPSGTSGLHSSQKLGKRTIGRISNLRPLPFGTSVFVVARKPLRD